jgi:hypothetical protein
MIDECIALWKPGDGKPGDGMEWTPWLRQQEIGTVGFGCWGLYSSKVRREAWDNR